MPPPGSGAVAPPQAPAPLENQPAEDALLDTANQAIMQMIDQETAEYQQIIAPLSQALQAVQMAQQVEQAEHPMDVTPPQGTVDVSPSAAPGGAGNPMQQQARRRVAAGDPYSDRYGPIDRGGPSIDDPTNGPTREAVHPDINKALRNRFEGGGDGAWHPDKPDTILHNLGNFWDGPREVRHLGGGELEYTSPYDGRKDRFNAKGYYTEGGEHRPWNYGEPGGPGYVDPKDWPIADPNYNGPGFDERHASLRKAKRDNILRNAAHLIANTYGVSERMLREAMGRRHYEHVAEAFRILPPQALRSPEVQAAALHIANMFAAENTMFNKNAFMQSVVGPASGSRLPFDRPRTAGETWKNTSTMDIYEHRGAGVQPEITDNMTINDLPEMPGASKHSGLSRRQADLMTKLRGWMQRQQDAGNNRGGDAMADQYLSEHPKIGPRGSGQVHQELNAEPHAPGDTTSPRVPQVPVVRAKNPVTRRGSWGEWEPTPAPAPKSAPKTAASSPASAYQRGYAASGKMDGPEFEDASARYKGEHQNEWENGWFDYASEIPHKYKEPEKHQEYHDRVNGKSPKTASFFTRRVPGWKWDDHLSGYLSKEARAFTCSCGQKIAAPSYKTCGCGKVWNVYAIGDSHHLASDTAEVYIAREIPVRPGVIMANRKMAERRYEFEDEDDADLERTLYHHQRKTNPKFREQFPSFEDYQNHHTAAAR